MTTSAVLRDLWDWWALEVGSLMLHMRAQFAAPSAGQDPVAGMKFCRNQNENERSAVFPGPFLTLHVSNNTLPFSRALAMGRAILTEKTPFQATDVHVLPGIEANGTCAYVVKKDALNRWLEDVLDPQARVDRLGLNGDDGIRWIPRRLVEDIHPAFRHIRRSRAYLASAVAALCILLAASYIHLSIRISAAQAEVDQSISGKKDEALAVRKLLDEQQRSLAAALAARRGKSSSVPLVLAWEELTRRLPDDVWLTDMSLDGLQLTITGFAARSAAQLIGTLDESPLFTDSGFISPVVRVPGHDGERFEIRLKIRQT